MRHQRNALSLVAFLFALPAPVLLVRRAFVFIASGGRHVGADVVLVAYGCVIASVVVALVAANREPLGKASLYTTSFLFAFLVAANAAGLFRALWW